MRILRYNTHKYVISLFHLDENLGLQERNPLLFAPAAGNFACDEAIPKDGWGDMDRVLTGELDCSTSARFLPRKARIKRTCVLEFVSDGGSTVWSGFVGKEVSQGLLLVLTDDGQGELNELGPRLSRGAAGRRNVVEILLAVHKGDMELPKLFWTDTGNLRVGRHNSG